MNFARSNCQLATRSQTAFLNSARNDLFQVAEDSSFHFQHSTGPEESNFNKAQSADKDDAEDHEEDIVEVKMVFSSRSKFNAWLRSKPWDMKYARYRPDNSLKAEFKCRSRTCKASMAMLANRQFVVIYGVGNQLSHTCRNRCVERTNEVEDAVVDLKYEFPSLNAANISQKLKTRFPHITPSRVRNILTCHKFAYMENTGRRHIWW